jgi:hypothetical protein
VQGRTELGKLGRRHLAEIQEMPPGLEDDRSRAGLLQRCVLGEGLFQLKSVGTGPVRLSPDAGTTARSG